MTEATQEPSSKNVAAPVTTIHRLPLAQIHPSKTNPRKHFDPAFITELSGLIKKKGFFGAILVRPHPEKKNAYEIVGGEQRYRASKEAGLESIPADLRAMSDIEALEFQVIENLARRDLTPFEEADGYNQLLKAKYTPQLIAERVLRTPQYVRDRVRLLKCVSGVRELFDAKRIEVGHCILLARQTPEVQVKMIREPGKAGKRTADPLDGALWDQQLSLGDEQSLPSPLSVRDLQEFICEAVSVKHDAPETAELFPEAAKSIEEAAAANIKVIQISDEHMDQVDGDTKILGRQSYQRADGRSGSKTCADSILGFNALGAHQGQAFKVCVARKTCRIHYKAEVDAAKERAKSRLKDHGAAATDKAARENEKATREKEQAARAKAAAARELEAQRLKRATPAIRATLVEKLKAAPLSKIQAVVSEEIRMGESDYQLASKLVASPKTADDFLRLNALAILISRLDPEGFDFDEAELKKWGVDVAKIIDSANANEAASKEAKVAKSAKKSKKVVAKKRG
jgi:ParB/RepB/Spo0J family partition protein